VVFVNAQPIDDDFGRRLQFAQHHASGAFGEYYDAVDCGEHRALTPLFSDDESVIPSAFAAGPARFSMHGSH